MKMIDNCRLFDFIICGIVIGFLCLFGLAGNGSAILVLSRHHTETATIAILQVLALIDSLLLVTTILLYTLPSILKFTETGYDFFAFLDKSKAYVWPVAMIAHTGTVWLTVMVTLTRYISVCKPMGRRNNRCPRDARVQVVGVLLLSIIYNIPRFFEHQPLLKSFGEKANDINLYDINDNYTGNFSQTFGTSDYMTSQPINLGDSRMYQIIYSNLIYFPVMFVIPLISLTYMNIRLVQTIRNIKTRRASMTGHTPRNDHITLCIVAIVCVFVLCQTPAMINQIFWAIQLPYCGSFHFYYTKISDVLVVLNSSCNFIIYCLFGQSFRKIFIETICRKKKDNEKDATEDRYNIPLIEICEACKSDFNLEANVDSSKTKTCGCRTTLNINTRSEQATLTSRTGTSTMNIKPQDNGVSPASLDNVRDVKLNPNSNNHLKAASC